GDPAMNFIWRNKGALAVGTTLTAFLASPEPFLNAAQGITQAVAEVPLTVAKEGTKEVARRTNWTLVFLAAIAGALTLLWYWLRSAAPWTRRKQATTPSSTPLPTTERN